MTARRIPTKQELLQLQKLYRTDKRIGQALGGVPEQLVAYWRRKKGVGKSVFPKYSLMEIKELWERFGDDEKAGSELQITKQAFYRWRKKYKLLERPTILKLEQLEFKFFDEQRMARGANAETPAQTYLQKIASYHLNNRFVKINESVEIPVDLTIRVDPKGIHLNAPNSNCDFATFEEMFAAGYFQPGRIVLSDSAESAALAVTNSLVEITDGLSFSNGNSAISSISLQIVPTIRIALASAQQIKHTPFDSACAILAAVKPITDQSFCLQLGGGGVERLTLEDRMSLLAYTRMLTGRHVIIEPDQTFLNLVSQFKAGRWPVPFSDKHVYYLDDLNVTLAKSRSLIYSVDQKDFVSDIATFQDRTLRRIRVGPVLGGTLEDFRVISSSLHEKTPQSLVAIYIAPRSKMVFLEALKRKYVHRIVEAGGYVASFPMQPPLPLLGDSDFELTTEMNGEMPSSYLASVPTMAAALASGKITRRGFETPEG